MATTTHAKWYFLFAVVQYTLFYVNGQFGQFGQFGQTNQLPFTSPEILTFNPLPIFPSPQQTNFGGFPFPPIAPDISTSILPISGFGQQTFTPPFGNVGGGQVRVLPTTIADTLRNNARFFSNNGFSPIGGRPPGASWLSQALGPQPGFGNGALDLSQMPNIANRFRLAQGMALVHQFSPPPDTETTSFAGSTESNNANSNSNTNTPSGNQNQAGGQASQSQTSSNEIQPFAGQGVNSVNPAFFPGQAGFQGSPVPQFNPFGGFPTQTGQGPQPSFPQQFQGGQTGFPGPVFGQGNPTGPPGVFFGQGPPVFPGAPGSFPVNQGPAGNLQIPNFGTTGPTQFPQGPTNGNIPNIPTIDNLNFQGPIGNPVPNTNSQGSTGNNPSLSANNFPNTGSTFPGFIGNLQGNNNNPPNQIGPNNVNNNFPVPTSTFPGFGGINPGNGNFQPVNGNNPNAGNNFLGFPPNNQNTGTNNFQGTGNNDVPGFPTFGGTPNNFPNAGGTSFNPSMFQNFGGPQQGFDQQNQGNQGGQNIPLNLPPMTGSSSQIPWTNPQFQGGPNQPPVNNPTDSQQSAINPQSGQGWQAGGSFGNSFGGGPINPQAQGNSFGGAPLNPSAQGTSFGGIPPLTFPQGNQGNPFGGQPQSNFLNSGQGSSIGNQPSSNIPATGDQFGGQAQSDFQGSGLPSGNSFGGQIQSNFGTGSSSPFGGQSSQFPPSSGTQGFNPNQAGNTIDQPQSDVVTTIVDEQNRVLWRRDTPVTQDEIMQAVRQLASSGNAVTPTQGQQQLPQGTQLLGSGSGSESSNSLPNPNGPSSIQPLGPSPSIGTSNPNPIPILPFQTPTSAGNSDPMSSTVHNFIDTPNTQIPGQGGSGRLFQQFLSNAAGNPPNQQNFQNNRQVPF